MTTPGTSGSLRTCWASLVIWIEGYSFLRASCRSGFGSQTDARTPRALKFRMRFLPQYPAPKQAMFRLTVITVGSPNSDASCPVDRSSLAGQKIPLGENDQTESSDAWVDSS